MSCLRTVVACVIALPLGACFDPSPPSEDTDVASTGGDDVMSPTTGPGPTATGPDPTATGPDPTATGPTATTLDTGTGEESSDDGRDVCGNGTIGDGEACDDANAEDGDGCSADCDLEDGFACEGQPSTCTVVCGDGLILGDEACDDANMADGDGCTACAIDPGYECQDEPSVCTLIVCGNGIIDGSEACDDANMADGDGCASDCSVELYSRCVGEGAGSCAPIRILYAPADNDDVAFRDAMQLITGGTVDFFAADGGTPTLADLEASYDCVITHPNFTYQDGMLFGDTLASYVDGGGNVVLGIASAYPPAGLMGSGILGVGYSPITSADIAFLPGPATYAGDGTTVIHQDVVTYAIGVIDMGVMVQGMGMQDSTFDEGTIATAYRPDFKVVYINGTGNEVIAGMGDWPRLFANGCGAGYVQ